MLCKTGCLCPDFQSVQKTWQSRPFADILLYKDVEPKEVNMPEEIASRGFYPLRGVVLCIFKFLKIIGMSYIICWEPVFPAWEIICRELSPYNCVKMESL
jgi:hypothetical protein